MGEIIGEIVLGLGLLAAGFVIGTLVFLAVRTGRWLFLRAERGAVVNSPNGRPWTVRIPLAPAPMRFWASRRMLRMRRTDRGRREQELTAPDGVASSELAHPVNLVQSTHELAPFVGAVLLALVAIALATFLVELVLVAGVAVVVAGFRVLWGRWHCEALGPLGERLATSEGSLREARAAREQMVEAISSGGSVYDFAR
jgi:hypothetical protein